MEEKRADEAGHDNAWIKVQWLIFTHGINEAKVRAKLELLKFSAAGREGPESKAYAMGYSNSLREFIERHSRK